MGGGAMFRMTGPVIAALTVMMGAPPATAQTFEVSPRAPEAARIFQKICLANRTQLSAGISALEKLNFIYDPGEDIWFHPTYDMSFAIRSPDDSTQYYCSMVWSSDDPLPVNVAAIRAIAEDADTPDFFGTDLMRTRISGTF